MQESNDTPTPPKYNAPGGAAKAGGGASGGYYGQVIESTRSNGEINSEGVCTAVLAATLQRLGGGFHVHVFFPTCLIVVMVVVVVVAVVVAVVVGAVTIPARCPAVSRGCRNFAATRAITCLSSTFHYCSVLVVSLSMSISMSISASLL